MKHVYCDFETRSLLSVKDVGAWKYAEHESTTPLMLAWKFRGVKQCGQWVERRSGRGMPEALAEIVADYNVVFHAFNASFEIAIYESICVSRWGWDPIARSRWRCTAAKAAHANQPRALGKVCKRLRTKERKDARGTFLLNSLSVPQKTVKAVKYTKDTVDGQHKKGEIRKDSITYLTEHGVELFDVPVGDKGKTAKFWWNDDQGLLDELAKYNVQDIVAEEDVDINLPDLPEAERNLWELDQLINSRGLPVDRELCQGVAKVFEVESDICNDAIAAIAREDDARPPNRQVERCTQTERIKNWVNERVNFGSSLSAELVNDWLAKPWGVRDKEQADRVREVLELRQIAGGLGVKKYWAAMDYIQQDDRIRGQLLYYGAATGRWAGKGIQPHNMLRMPIPEEVFFEAISRGDHAEVNLLAELGGYTTIGLLKTCVRGLIRAEQGKTLVVSDFAGIEARVLQWLAGNEEALQLFRDGADMYVHEASNIFGIPYDDMMVWSEKKQKHVCGKTFKEKRQIGKIAVLALGYQMGADKYQYTCQRGWGVDISQELANDIVAKWREANPAVVEMWSRLDRAFKAVLKNKAVKAKIGKYLRVFWRDGYLIVRLPSGRELYYFGAELYKNEKGFQSIRYLDGGKQWVDTYGGKICENVVQAISRDLLVHSAFVAHNDGLFLIGHVHDELICEELIDEGEAFAKLHRAMESKPDWAEGLPLAAATYSQERYTK